MLCSDQMLIIAFLLYKLLLVCWWLPTVESLWKLACFLLLVWFGANLIILFVWLCLVHAQGWLDWLNCSQEHLVSMVLCHIRGQDYHGVHYWSVSVLMQVPWTGYTITLPQDLHSSVFDHTYIYILPVWGLLCACVNLVYEFVLSIMKRLWDHGPACPLKVTNGFLVNTMVSTWTLLNKEGRKK